MMSRAQNGVLTCQRKTPDSWPSGGSSGFIDRREQFEQSTRLNDLDALVVLGKVPSVTRHDVRSLAGYRAFEKAIVRLVLCHMQGEVRLNPFGRGSKRLEGL